MWTLGGRRCGTWLLLGAVALVAWGTVGFYQGLHSGFSGGLYDPQYVVPGIIPGGLADRAGFRVGDRVISVEGTPVERLGMESRWPRSLAPKIGQSRRFIVERNGERVPIDVVYPPPFPRAVNNRIGAALVGLGFLCFGLWALLTVRNAPALALAQVGLAAGAAASLGLGPNLGSWNGVQGHISTAASVLMYILLLRFFVTFPTPKRVSESRLGNWAVFGAWGGLLVFLVVELAVHPALYYTTGSVTGPLMQVYAVLILAAIAHTVLKSSRQQRRSSGMNLILGGFLLAILAMAAAFTAVLRLPSWVYSLGIVAIPLAMALAVRRQAITAS